MLQNMKKVNKNFFPIMSTPLEKIAEEKTGNYQSLLKGGGGVPPIGKRPIYFWVFFLRLP